LDRRVHLLVGALQDELGLAELLAPEPDLHLELLDLAEEALLLPPQPGQVLLQRGPPLADGPEAVVGERALGQRPRPQGKGRRHREAREEALHIRGLPSRPSGGGTSRSFRMVGERSMMCGVVVPILRFVKSTPPLISVAVAQWSPLHLRLLFSTT